MAARPYRAVRKHWGQLRQSNEARQKRMAGRCWSPKTKVTRRPVRQCIRPCAQPAIDTGKGGNIGPNLDAYQLNNPGFVIPAVVDPNLGIREEFAGFNVITKDNQRLTGFIAQNAPRFIVLRIWPRTPSPCPARRSRISRPCPFRSCPRALPTR